MSSVSGSFHTTPEAVGVSSNAVYNLIDALEHHVAGMHSIMLLRHGQCYAAGWWHPYSAERKHTLFSVSKSFAATAVGFAVKEGVLSLDDRVITFFPEQLPAAVSPHLEAMRVYDLLTMTTGHHVDATAALLASADGNWVRAFLAQPVEHAPGTYFVYNSAATYMLSAIVQRMTGQRLSEYLAPRLFVPLGITNTGWETCPRGIDIGGWGMAVTTEEIARFGQCYLQQGVYGSQQVIPADWVAQATAYQVPNGTDAASDWNQGYGFQFWRCRHNAYRGDGAFGQFCVVLPEHDAVIVITSGVDDMQQVLNQCWEHLLPAFAAAPLPDNAQAANRLRERLAGLHIAPRGQQYHRPDNYHATFSLEPNRSGYQQVQIATSAAGGTIRLQGQAGTTTLAYAPGQWHESTTDWADMSLPLSRPAVRRVCASGGWESADTLRIRVLLIEMPYAQEYTIYTDGAQVVIERKTNVGFGDEIEQFTGTAV